MTAGSEKSSNFFLGFLLLPKDKREALSAVYQYCRLIDDIVDSGSLKRDEATGMLSFWESELSRLYAGKPTHSVSQRLLPSVEKYSLPEQEFREMIRGCRMDLEQTRYKTFDELQSYMRGVAGSVGRLSVRIFGYEHTPSDRIEQFADLFGQAFQLTNIIRDVGADLEMGRVYLPEADMAAAGYSREALIRREHSLAFDRLMEEQYRRAKTLYRRARSLVDFRDRPALAPAEIMAHVYEGVLDEIKVRGFRVLFDKTSLSPWRKGVLAGKGWLYCHGVHL